MRNFIISTETACDLTKEQLEKYNIETMPMNFYINGEEYTSSSTTLTTEDICEKMRNGAKTKTSQPNESEVFDYLSSLLSRGQDILHLSFSSAMSGTCATFKKIAEDLNKHHDNKIIVVDTLAQSAGLGLLVQITAEKADSEGFNIEDAKLFVEELKLNINHYFIVEDLKYLARGGRISPTLATIGNIIKLKPVLYLDNAGRITQLHKVLGRKKSISTLIEKFINNYKPISNKVIIAQADCINDAEYLKSQLLLVNPELNIEINPLGPIIVSHAGPGTMALFITTEKR